MFRHGRGSARNYHRRRRERFSPLINDANNFFFMNIGDNYKFHGYE